MGETTANDEPELLMTDLEELQSTLDLQLDADWHALITIDDIGGEETSPKTRRYISLQLQTPNFWRVQVECQDGSYTETNTRVGAGPCKIGPLEQLSNLPSWLAEVTAELGFTVSVDHSHATVGRDRDAAAKLIEWALSKY